MWAVSFTLLGELDIHQVQQFVHVSDVCLDNVKKFFHLFAKEFCEEVSPHLIRSGYFSVLPVNCRHLLYFPTEHLQAKTFVINEEIHFYQIMMMEYCTVHT